MRCLKLSVAGLLLSLWLFIPTGRAEAADFRLGLNADNWSGQIESETFRTSVRSMGIDFVVWHIVPEEIYSGGVLKLIEYCRSENMGYLFNTEMVNYVPGVPEFQAADGCYRWDLPVSLLEAIKDDPLFLGVVYDESLLIQSLLGTKGADGQNRPPYYADTAALSPEAAFEAVAARISHLSDYYQRFGGTLVLETLFPDEAFVGARGGALLAPKLLKENYNDLMTMMARSAALQYLESSAASGRGRELWACLDLWFLDGHPNGEVHKLGPTGGHTASAMAQTLRYAYLAGYDAVYIEREKGLLNAHWELAEHGRAVVEFQKWLENQPERTTDWRTPPPPVYTVRLFPSGNPGGRLPEFLDMRSYGSPAYRFRDCAPGGENPYFQNDAHWWLWFMTQTGQGDSLETFPGLTLNSVAYDSGETFDGPRRPYKTMSGLPETRFYDHTAPTLQESPASFNFCPPLL